MTTKKKKQDNYTCFSVRILETELDRNAKASWQSAISYVMEAIDRRMRTEESKEEARNHTKNVLKKSYESVFQPK